MNLKICIKLFFSNSEKYVKVIEACYTKWQGITHTELVKLSGLSSGGSLTRIVRDLEVSGFIHQNNPIDNKNKNTLIRLVDEYSIFYLKFVKQSNSPNWQAVSKSQSFVSWQGFAFENLCIKHISSIKKKLGVSGVNTREYSYREQGNSTKNGVQIDVIIDRDDQVLNICEAKFYNKPFVITKLYHEQLQMKMQKLNAVVPRNKTLHLTMITSLGLKENKYSSIVQSEIVLDDMFD